MAMDVKKFFKAGGPAFPLEVKVPNKLSGGVDFSYHFGVSMRDWFAVQAPKEAPDDFGNQHPEKDLEFPKKPKGSYCSGCDCGSDCETPEICDRWNEWKQKASDFSVEFQAKRQIAWSYYWADLMIAERGK